VLRRFWGYDRVTAYFAAAPGGLNEMVLVGGALGGDERVLTLIHSARVMLVVLAVPFWFMLTVGYEPGGAIGAAGWGEASDIAWLAASGIVGYAIGKALRMPAGSLLGPMLVSAAVHLGGLTGSAPPATLVAVAQLVMGCSLGCRFAGTALPAVFRALGAAIPITLAMLAVMALFAWGLSAVTGISPIVIALAYAPGGLAEMSLIALYLGQDPAFVSSHHIIRISLIISLAPALFRLVDRKPAP
jgi:membrane AbrB-like protein